MDLIELGLAIRQARLEKAIQQEELCAIADISRATLSRLENGRLPELGIRKIMTLCALLHLELTLQPAQKSKRPTLRMLSANVDLTRKVRDGVKIDGKRFFMPHDTTQSAALPKRVRRAKSTKGNDE